MIKIHRKLARRLRSVFRRGLNITSRGVAPPLVFQTSADGLTIRAQSGSFAVEFREPGHHDSDQIVVPFDALTDCQGTRDEPATLVNNSDQQVAVSWNDDGNPHERRYDAIELPEASRFPSLPKKLTPNEPRLLATLHDAMQTAARDSIHYALNTIRLRGKKGRIDATDASQLLVQKGFEFPWKDEVLVPRTDVFGSRELPADQPVEIGRTKDHITVRVGPWTFHLAILKDGRYPDVDQHIGRVADAVATLHLSASDAEFLLNSANKLPGRSELNSPVTVDLNGTVSIRAMADDQSVPTELVLANTTATGKPLRVNMNRCFLTRALKLGFREIHLFGPETTVLCQDEHRSYVWMQLSKEGTIPPSKDAQQITSPSVEDVTVQSPTQPSQKRKRTRMKRSSSNKNGKAAQSSTVENTSVDSLITQAESVKETLRGAQTKTSELITALKQHRKHSKLVRSTLASLRQLQSVEV